MLISEFKDYVDMAFAPYIFFEDHAGINGVFYAFHKKIVVARHPGGKWIVTTHDNSNSQAISDTTFTWSTLSRAINAFFHERDWMIHEPDDQWYPDWEKLES